ncbi:hypothetical protein TNCV_244651 [Trichonephila clavipes]|uniref:Uncharacterized protein n=1 Tax=Trichonephila clavipes TaxID=2585209 RepID=A0A8X6V6W1_TRICX|nr:hypothetical protein TNCV_244651 [Trichonephila clavipes]
MSYTLNRQHVLCFTYYRQCGCDSALLQALAEKYGKDCLDWDRYETARAAGLSKAEIFIHEVLDDAASVMNITEKEHQEQIL